MQSTFSTCHPVPAVTKFLTIWLLCDGKPGHENQSLGLAEAMARQIPCVIHTISIAGKSWLRGLAATSPEGTPLPTPDFIIAAGHATHFALLWLARKHQAKSIVLMRPSLPMSWFDLCIAPAHDFPKPPQRENLIITRGALNRISAPVSAEKSSKLILIGGPSATHGWDGPALLESLAAVASSGAWRLTNSRRTPPGLMDEIRKRLPHIELFPHEDTDPQWLPTQLASAAEVWVTEDSVSMVYEALSSGASVGLLPVPRLKSDSRVLSGLEQLTADGFLTLFADWWKTRALTPPPEILREADRCAKLVIRNLSL